MYINTYYFHAWTIIWCCEFQFQEKNCISLSSSLRDPLRKLLFIQCITIYAQLLYFDADEFILLSNITRAAVFIDIQIYKILFNIIKKLKKNKINVSFKSEKKSRY